MKEVRHIKRVQTYHDVTDDVVTTNHQTNILPKDYRWHRDRWWERLWSLIFRGLAKAFAYVYCYANWRLTVVNRGVLKPFRHQGYFMYANHTQPVNDAFMPLVIGGAQRFHAIVSPANFTLPILGPNLPYGGALPTATTTSQTIQLIKAVDRGMNHNNYVVIYPEAHVWPYYTKIRPFPETSFSFPVKTQKPVFCMTTTYQKRKFGKRPRLTVYIDGPFQPTAGQSRKAQQHELWQDVTLTLKRRSAASTYEYIHYKRDDS